MLFEGISANCSDRYTRVSSKSQEENAFLKTQIKELIQQVILKKSILVKYFLRQVSLINNLFFKKNLSKDEFEAIF
jgi:hypothetical protein